MNTAAAVTANVRNGWPISGTAPGGGVSEEPAVVGGARRVVSGIWSTSKAVIGYPLEHQ